MKEEKHIVDIIEINQLTHNVKSFKVEKPDKYSFKPGQATEVSINKEGWREEKRPFTFTSLSEKQHLEFTIKIYDDHKGVTNELDSLKLGDQLILHDVWGAIQYKGPGYFIAGGAGITPFIAIFRQLRNDSNLDDHYLIFSNRAEKDIILKNEFDEMLGKRFINTLTEEKTPTYHNKMIDKSFLKEMIHDFRVHFYICGPEKMVKDIQRHLDALGVEPNEVVFEK